MSNSDIRRQLEKGDSLAFEKTDLYKKVFALAEQKSGKTLPRLSCRVFSWKARRSHVT